jgi:subtilisin family serine protease
MFLKSRAGENAPPAVAKPGAARQWLAGIALASVALAAGPAQAQLPVGGFLGVDRIDETLRERVEQEFENSVEFATEQNIQENIEDNIEEAIEQSVDATVEETIEEVVAESVDAAVEEGISDTVAQAVDEQIEDDLTHSIETGIEEAVESSVEETVLASVESGVEDAVAESVEEEVHAGVEFRLEETVEDTVQVAVEEAAEAAAEASVEAGVEDAVEQTVEESVAEVVEESVTDAVEDSVAAAVEDDVEGGVEAGLEDAIEAEVDRRVMLAIEDRLDLEIDEIVDNLESDLEIDESRILKEQWLVMAEPSVFQELGNRGYLFDTVTDLPALGLRLAEVAAPSSFDITDVRNGVLDVVGKDRAEVDLNHFYTAGAPVGTQEGGVAPRAAMQFPADLDELDLRVGMIDSHVDTSHPALASSRIESRSFARPGAQAPDFHGTAIASIIAGNSDEYRGLAPKARLYAASVFELDEARGEVASTVSLIRALDWLMSSGVEVVNISLAGPPNRLLEKALERAAEQDVVVMAAAGNGGPVARPMYPAAYDSVVAVTAVDAAQQVFRLANRGDYLALAAPGVDLRHARSGGGYVSSSGTSFAVPFAVTAAARLRHLQPQTDIITMLLESALDIGPPGRDSIYGYGLLTLGII